MNPSVWTMVVGGAAGLALAGFGVRMLLTGRAPGPTARAFRSAHDAGCYHLLFGVALVLVVVGTGLAGTLPPVVTTVLAVVLVGWAMARYRPRGRRAESDPK
jgi:hypothetical protein